MRPHLDYGGILYDPGYNFFFHKNVESVKYNTALVITLVINVGTEKFVAYSK